MSDWPTPYEFHAFISIPVHAWNYRRYVLASMPVKKPDTEELVFTTKKIQANFSNFSAWHQRSKIYPLLWGSDSLDRKTSQEEGARRHSTLAMGNLLGNDGCLEFDLVRNAMYTDPDDQSVWVYHRWLVGSGRFDFR